MARGMRPLAWMLVGIVLGALGLGLIQRYAGSAEAEAGPVDIGFAQFMSLHHQQAIGMAQMMLAGEPTRLQQLAKSIAYTQLLELGEMQGWLRLWGQPLLPKTRSMTWMLAGDEPPGEALKQYLIDCEQSATGMPGLATMEELGQLRVLTGRERDRRFLELMLAHHQGGIPMAEFAVQQAQLKVVRDLARRVVMDQSEEVQQIRRTLLALEQLERE